MNRQIDLFTIASGVATVVIGGLAALVIDGRLDIAGGWLIAISVGLIGLALVLGGTRPLQRRNNTREEDGIAGSEGDENAD